MEVTPKVFREVQFREKGRGGGGYHPEDVDEFLEQAALGVEQLLGRLHQAEERVRQLEESASEAASSEELLKRTLVLAQRTADQVVQEAREEAARIVAEARAQGEALLAEGAARGQRAYEDAIADQRSNLEAAEAALRQIQRESNALREWVDQHRAHLLSALADAQALVQSAGLLSEPPAVSLAPRQGAGGQPSTGLVPGDEALRAGTAQADGQEVAQLVARGEEGQAGNAREVARTYPEAAMSGGGQLVARGAGDGASTGQLAPAPEAAQDPATFPPPPLAATGGAYPGPPTMALDERALESFFSDNDLEDDQRPSGRLRHRH
ncbi:MAG: DivIVA domain-containing protein [Acidimicrobiales bacterium]